MNELKNLLVIICVFILSSCNIGQTSNQDQKPFFGSVTIGHISTIPYSSYSNDYALLPIQNNSNQTVFFSSANATQNAIALTTSKYLDLASCNVILPNQICYVKILANQQIGYQIDIIYETSNHHKINLKQIVNFSNNLSQNDGMIISSQDNWVSPVSALSIPVLLSKPYSNIEAKLGNSDLAVICSQPNTSSHNICTVVIPAMSVSNKNNVVTINLYNENFLKSTILYTTNITVTNNTSANIISSAINPVISPVNGSNPVSITLLNNGTGTASSLKISGVTPVQIQNSTCDTSLNSAQACSFQVNVTSSTSGQSSVIISYTNSNGTQLLLLNVSYISITPSSLLTLTPNGSFTNVAINQGNVYLTVNVQNTGNATLQNLQFNNINAANSAMSSFVNGSTCSNGQSIASGSSCNMVLSYNPTSAQSGTVTFIVTGNYYNQVGQLQTYSNSSLILSYSAVSGAIFKAVGDFGMVITSPAGTAGTWTANIDSPFATTAISGNSLLVNNGTYVMSMSNGSIKYSTLNGLFWQTSTLGGTAALNASSCSIAYDGIYYYTCGTVSTAFASTCTTTGRGCVIRTNNLNSSWTALFTPAQAVAVNDLFYFNNGTNSAYVAAIANATASTGLATSTNGSTWAATSSGQTTAANNNFTPVVLNTTTNSLTAWDSVGWSSTEPISTVTTAWTANTTNRPANRPANRKVTSALFQGSAYVLTLANGNIYTATSPTGTYTQRSTNATQLNRIIFADNIGGGTYLSVGNSGVNLTTTTPTGTWTAQTVLTTGQATVPNLTGAYYDGSNIWVTGVSTILKSNNATSWTTPGLQSITKNGSTYLAVDNQGNIYSSSNGTSWIQQTNPTSNILNHIYCAAQNLCFAVGNSGTILKSTDGTNWSQLSSGTSNNLQEITCNNETCIIVGGNGAANSGTILSSNDYTSWSIITTSLATTGLNSITYYNNSYIAVGNTGTIFSSTNGINWQSVTSGTTQNLNSIDCGNNIGCVAVGNAGTIIFSAFDISWSAATSSTTNDLLSVAYDGVFAAVGKGGVLRYSATGSGTWSSATFPTTSSATNNINAIISN